MEENKKMMKKLISLLCCLVPFGAGAEIIYPNSGANVSTDESAWANAISANQSLAISTVAPGSTTPVVAIVSNNGFVVDNLFAGAATDGGSPLNLYILNTAANPFAIVSKADVSINSMLQVMDGVALNVKTETTGGTSFDLNVGNSGVNDGIVIGNNASLNIRDVIDLTVNGNITASGNADIGAENITANSLMINSSLFVLNATNAAQLGDVVFNADGATDSIFLGAGAGGIGAENIQNNGLGLMNISSNGGTVNVVQNLQNNGKTLQVTSGDLVVGGGIFNASTGTMTLGGAGGLMGLAVNGGALKNNGNLYVNVTGDMSLAGGLDLSDASADKVVQITTGSLNLGTVNSIANNLNNMDVVITDSNFNIGTISNGANGNTNSNLSVNVTKNITVDNVSNAAGTLNVDAANITINDSFVAATGTTTVFESDAALVSSAVIDNSGDMDLKGASVTITGATNSGVLDITTPVESGTVMLTGAVNNSGATNIVANTVSANAVGAILNDAGTTNITANSVTLGAINVNAGAVDVNATGGAVTVTNDVIVGKLQDGEYVSSGQLNLAAAVSSLTAGGEIIISGDFNATAAETGNAGNLNVANVGTNPFVVQSDSITVSGDFNVVSTDETARQVQINSNSFDVDGNFVADGENVRVVLGNEATDTIIVAGNTTIDNQAVVETFASDVTVGALDIDGQYITHGISLTATSGGVNIAGDINAGGAAAEFGISIDNSVDFSIVANAEGADITASNVSVAATNKLTLNVNDDISLLNVINRGTLDINVGDALAIQSLTNLESADFTANNIWLGNAENSAELDVNATENVLADSISNSGNIDVVANIISVSGDITNTAGKMVLDAESVKANSIVVSGGVVNATADSISLRGVMDISGDLYHGGTNGALNIAASGIVAESLNVSGNFVADSGTAVYNVTDSITIAGDLENYADITFGTDGLFSVDGIVINDEDLNVSANGVKFASMQNLGGNATVDSGTGVFNVGALVMNGGNLVLRGAGITVDSPFSTDSMLYQNYNGDLFVNDINIQENNYAITAPNFSVGGINQRGRLTVNSSDIFVNGSIDAHDLRFLANDARNWMNVDIRGDVSNGVDFIGLEKMSISGNYIFGTDSIINAAILPYAIGGTIDSTDVNYWATVSMTDENTPSQIEKPQDAAPLINVGGTFTAGSAYTGNVINGVPLSNGQIGIELYDAVDTGTAIWLLHANGGIQDMGQIEKLRNLDVQFCNADGSLCYDYLKSLSGHNSSDADLPAYVSVRDNDLYIVFDPRFGGPVLLQDNPIQQIVLRDNNHTSGEFVAAGALDNMIYGRAHDMKFYNKTPIEVIPLIFDGTNMEQMGNEIYNRLVAYDIDKNPTPLANFSRLNQMREVEQVAGAIVLNEHTAFRSFEDRMFDEFIWNRNRQLNKAWVDVDYGMMVQDVLGGDHADGYRFSLSGGFDWQESNTLQLGLTGRITHTSSKTRDSMDLSYADVVEMGHVNVDVTDTNVGLGGYLMKTLGDKARVYGNAFVDIHVLDVNRNQNFVGAIDGNGTAFSLISEWGLIHDILNQYIVGNAYARVGYNFGFSLTEKVAGDDYMKMESDGYLVLTPGYSLIAQKRIYPSAWFQIRPYASVGIEYDLLGAPDSLNYKFMSANSFTKYDIDIEPMWMNIGGGVELLSAHGIQVGIDYRYQYNSAIQLHNIKVSGSYRF